MTLKGMPRRLDDGSWGAWVPGVVPRDGTRLEITARNGFQFYALVRRVVSVHRFGCVVETTTQAFG